MKKVILLLISFSMVISLVGCGERESGTPIDDSMLEESGWEYDESDDTWANKDEDSTNYGKYIVGGMLFGSMMTMLRSDTYKQNKTVYRSIPKSERKPTMKVPVSKQPTPPKVDLNKKSSTPKAPSPPKVNMKKPSTKSPTPKPSSPKPASRPSGGKR